MTAKEICKRILEVCRETGGMTRSEVAASTGLGRMTVSRAVERLLDIGALREVVSPHGEHNRPTGSLSFAPHVQISVLDLSQRDFTWYIFNGSGEKVQKMRYFYSDSLDFYDNLYSFGNRILSAIQRTTVTGTILIPPDHAPWIAGKLCPEYPDDERIAAKLRSDLGLDGLDLLTTREAVGTALSKEKGVANFPVFYLRVSDTLSAFSGNCGNLLPLRADRIPIRGTSPTLGKRLAGDLPAGRAEAVLSVFYDMTAVLPGVRIYLDTNDEALATAVQVSHPDISVTTDSPLYLRGAVRHMLDKLIEFFSEKAAKPLAFPRDL